MKIDLKKNFWEINVGWDVIPVFEELKKEYGKNNSSYIMWAIYLIYHPESGVYKAIDDVDKRYEIVKSKFLIKRVIPDWNSKLIKDAIKMFDKIGVSEHLKGLIVLEKKIGEFRKMAEKMTITKNNADDVVKNLEASGKLFDMYKKKLDLFIEEEEEKKRLQLRGGGTLSAVQDYTLLFDDKDFE